MPTIADLAISSPQFGPAGRLEDRNAYDKENELPPLTVSGAPEGTVELAVVCHDPDAPLPNGYTHWTLYGIPATGGDLGSDADERYRPGPNGWGEHRWGGPRPPAGHGVHHYYFWVYALSRPVEGTPSREEFLRDYADAILEQNRLVGTYER
ncbi:YbhB/YbcL family Raf kinase inhibitor-like protein [Blastococcus sp. SYSU D00669]